MDMKADQTFYIILLERKINYLAIHVLAHIISSGKPFFLLSKLEVEKSVMDIGLLFQ